jgi:4-diphosphocytidyl-2-C-methyl-D-erythritol kinase
MSPEEEPARLTGVAPAKLNLFLHVTGKRADGYHLLDSLVAFADIADQIQVERADHLTLSVTGPFASNAGPVEENLVLRAARALQEATSRTDGAKIWLDKHIPTGAGLGGGSSDAASALRLLNKLWKLDLADDELRQIGLALGADIPVCLAAGPTRMRGIGEVLDPAGVIAPLDILLVHPGQSLSTPAVFKALAGRYSGPAPSDLGSLADRQSLLRLLRSTTNDLEAPARELLPTIGHILNSLSDTDGCLLAQMSGSGSACFGLFGNNGTAQAAGARIASLQPDWWVQTCELSAAPTI